MKSFKLSRQANMAVAFLAAAMMLIAPGSSPAQDLGGITLTPTRIVMQGRDRTATLNILNRSNSPGTYRLSLRDALPTEEAGTQLLPEGERSSNSATDMIRFSPREVSLGPGESQTIRLLFRRPAGLQEGEYMSRLAVRTVPPPTLGESIEPSDASQGIRLRLIPVVQVTIPIIVRHGDLEVATEIADADLEDGEEGPVLDVWFTRQGRASTSGNVRVIYNAPAGDSAVVGDYKGIALYNPLSKRRFEFPLRPPEGVQLSGGTLELVYQAVPEEGGGILAQATIPVP